MNQLHDVIIERENGHYRATLAMLPRISVQADSRDFALQQLRQVALNYFAQVELATIDLGTATETPLRIGSPQAVLQAMAASTMDTEDELYQEFLANLAAAKERDRAAASASETPQS